MARPGDAQRALLGGLGTVARSLGYEAHIEPERAVR